MALRGGTNKGVRHAAAKASCGWVSRRQTRRLYANKTQRTDVAQKGVNETHTCNWGRRGCGEVEGSRTAVWVLVWEPTVGLPTTTTCGTSKLSQANKQAAVDLLPDPVTGK